MNGWRIDDDGSLRTPEGMKVGVVTEDGDLLVRDRVIHRDVAISLLALIDLWRRWRSRPPKTHLE